MSIKRKARSRLVKLASVPVDSGGLLHSPDVGGTGLVINPLTGNVFNANSAANTVSVIGSHRNMVVSTISTGADPFTLAVDPNTGTIFVIMRALNRIGAFEDKFTP